jgi:hypothetical protein
MTNPVNETILDYASFIPADKKLPTYMSPTTPGFKTSGMQLQELENMCPADNLTHFQMTKRLA